MPTLVPVDFDPFESKAGEVQDHKLVPVDHDPFAAQKQPADQDKGFWGNMTSSLGARVKETKDILSQPDPYKPENVLQRAYQTTGNVFGGVGDIIGAGVKSAYKNLTPDALQKSVSKLGSDFTQSVIGKKAIGALQSGSQAWEGFKKNHPDIARDVEATLNVGAFYNPLAKEAGAGIKGAAGVVKEGLPDIIKATGKEGLGIASDVASMVKKTPTVEGIDSQLKATVEKNIRKAIGSGVEGQRTAGQIEKYTKNATDAVSTIVENKSDLELTGVNGEKIKGELPKNLMQFSESIDQAKKKIYDTYNSMATHAGILGAKIDMRPAITKLRQVAHDSEFALKPEVGEYASKLADRLEQIGRKSKDPLLKNAEPWVLSPEVVQAQIADLNRGLESFYKQPSYNTASNAYVDSQLAHELRQSLDAGIENALGQPGYQDLKRQYGALKSIEKDVNRRAVVDARKSPVSLMDYTDVYISPEILRGIITADPVALAKGSAMKAVKEYLKFKRDPNNIVKTMFQDVDKYTVQKNAAQVTQELGIPMPLKSKTGSALQNMISGAGGTP
jgi:hypothetical protein